MRIRAATELLRRKWRPAMTNDKYLPAKAVEIHKHRVRMKYGLAIEAMQTILNGSGCAKA